MKLKIPVQESTIEANTIFCRLLIRLCMENGLQLELIKILKDCGIKYEVIE